MAWARETAVWRTLLVALVAALTLALTACSSSGPEVADSDDREVGIYSVVLDWLIAGADMPVGDEEGPALFVASRSEAPIDVDVQVVLVDAFVETVPLRFVDVWTEAVMKDEPDLPIHDGSMLVGLGAVDAEGEVVEVYADRYFSQSRAEAWIVTLERSGEDGGGDAVWQIAGRPVSSDIRPFTDDS